MTLFLDHIVGQVVQPSGLHLRPRPISRFEMMGSSSSPSSGVGRGTPPAVEAETPLVGDCGFRTHFDAHVPNGSKSKRKVLEIPVSKTDAGKSETNGVGGADERPPSSAAKMNRQAGISSFTRTDAPAVSSPTTQPVIERSDAASDRPATPPSIVSLEKAANHLRMSAAPVSVDTRATGLPGHLDHNRVQGIDCSFSARSEEDYRTFLGRIAADLRTRIHRTQEQGVGETSASSTETHPPPAMEGDRAAKDRDELRDGLQAAATALQQSTLSEDGRVLRDHAPAVLGDTLGKPPGDGRPVLKAVPPTGNAVQWKSWVTSPDAPAAGISDFAPQDVVSILQASVRERRQSGAARRNEENTVHVHIGRIEIKATNSPPPPKTERAAAMVMSLEEYLKLRTHGE